MSPVPHPLHALRDGSIGPPPSPPHAIPHQASLPSGAADGPQKQHTPHWGEPNGHFSGGFIEGLPAMHPHMPWEQQQQQQHVRDHDFVSLRFDSNGIVGSAPLQDHDPVTCKCRDGKECRHGNGHVAAEAGWQPKGHGGDGHTQAAVFGLLALALYCVVLGVRLAHSIILTTESPTYSMLPLAISGGTGGGGQQGGKGRGIQQGGKGGGASRGAKEGWLARGAKEGGYLH